MDAVVRFVSESWALGAVLVFVAGYPILSGSVWTVTALLFARRRETEDESFYDILDEALPRVSIVVPAYREGDNLNPALEALHVLDYPDYEVVVVDDGSDDTTAGVALEHATRDERFHVLRKLRNEGKAMAMNDAMPMLTGEIVLIVDADACLDQHALKYIVPHFVRLPRVGAVTGNPRVSNVQGVLPELQALEFSAIVSILRRAQVVWGRILTVSGVISAFRKSALEDVGLFDPSMATEDIEVTWRLQRRFYDVRYEPHALVDMVVPTSTAALWRQRRRWATGLAQVLRRHASILLHWRNRRHWPVVIEAIASIVWAHLLVVLIGFWILSALTGTPARGASPFPNGWGMVIASVCLVQIFAGVWLDHRYDRRILRSLRLAPLYPAAYWAFSAVVTVRSTIPALFSRPPRVSQWHSVRDPGVVFPAPAGRIPAKI